MHTPFRWPAGNQTFCPTDPVFLFRNDTDHPPEEGSPSVRKDGFLNAANPLLWNITNYSVVPTAFTAHRLNGGIKC